MTRSSSASMTSLMMMVMACFLVLASAEEKSSVLDQDRQSRQFLLAPELYNYPSGSPLPFFYSYGQPLMMPVGDVLPVDPNEPYVYSPSSSGNSAMERAFQNQQADIRITPSATECLFSNLATEGSVLCRKASQARRGDITMTFTAANQIANFAITAPTNFKIKLTCSAVTNVNAFTQSVRITATTTTPLTESNYMNIAVRSAAGANPLLRCSWDTSRQ